VGRYSRVVPEYGGGEPMIVRMGFGVDVVGYSARPAMAKLDAQTRMVALVDSVLTAIGVDHAEVDRQPSGDGMIVFLPASVSLRRALVELFDAARWLAEDNRRYRDRLRVRMSAVIGPAGTAPAGYSGNTVIECARLLNSDVLRVAMAGRADSDLAILISDSLYTYVVDEGYPELAAPDFERVDVHVKDFHRHAWLWTGKVNTVHQGRRPQRALRDHAYGKLTNGMLLNLAVAATTLLVLVMVVDNAGGRPNGPGGPDTHVTERQPQPARSSTSLPERPPTVSPGTSVRLIDFAKSAGGNGWVKGPRTIAGTGYSHSYIATVASSPSCAESVPTIEFDIDGLYQRFQATVGVSDSADTATRAQFAVSFDGTDALVTDSIVSGHSLEIDLTMSGVHRLRLTVRNANQCGGWYVWGDPRLSR
jgi:NPCBM/NEW2 domain